MGFERTSRLDGIRRPRSLARFGNRSAFVALVVVFLLASCAVPVAPSGGPADDTPPNLVEAIPADGSTGFTGRTIELTFSEHVDRRSFPGAVSLQPDPGGRLEFDWNGKTVEITLPEDPRPETTYILSIDNSLRDARNVSLDRPITLAFATGETIDAGRLAGRVIRAHDGAPGAGIDIYAYATPDSALFLGRPLYRTQTDRDGAFTFSYLRETDYFVVGVRDRNGNRRLDANEDVALPPVSSIRADTLSASQDSTGLVWIMDRFDDIPPSIDRVASTGPNHIELRFSELVRLASRDAPDLSLRSAADEPVVIRDVYSTVPGLTRNLGLHTDELTPGTYTLSGPFPAVDSTGNMAAPSDFAIEIADSTDRAPRVLSFMPDSSAGVRFESMLNADPEASDGAGVGAAAAAAGAGAQDPVRIWPGDRAGVRFDIPAANAVTDGFLAARDTAGTDLSGRLRQSGPVTWIFRDSSLAVPFELIVSPEVAASDSSISIAFIRADRSLTGELSGTVVTRPQTDGANRRIVVELYRDGGTGSDNRSRTSEGSPRQPPLRTVTTQGRSFVIAGLPDGLRVRLRAFVDTNANGTWDAGQAVPFIPPEPVAWIRATEPVRARWETALSDTLYLYLTE